MTNTDNQPTAKSWKDDFKRRISQVKTSRWIRFSIVTALFIAWMIWLGEWWPAIFILLLFDIYITGYIPFTWWKKSKSKTVRSVMSWVDAIVYALILVYFVFNFIGQNYQIPSSSLEKTLLTGDYLWVNKITYGPRVPMTPVHFPLVHNTLPIINTKSYLDNPSVSYKRLKGLRSVETGDIVVFNFPAGDTVTTRYEASPEYYDLLVDRYGWARVNNDKNMFGDVIYRPVDRRQNFVKRAVGLPGERIRIVDDTIYIDGKAQPMPENVQFNYIVALSSPLTPDMLYDLGVTEGDCEDLNAYLTPIDRANLLTWMPKADIKSYLYALPLTQGMIDSLRDKGMLTDLIKSSVLMPMRDYLFPKGVASQWSLSNYGGDEGLLIPAKGLTVPLNRDTWAVYNRAIRNYEGHTDAYIDNDGKVYIDGKQADSYTFAMDYYFMMGDNRDNSQDSRFWGFVPEDHIVGTPVFVLVSFDKDRSIFNGGIRWNRILRDANPDK